MSQLLQKLGTNVSIHEVDMLFLPEWRSFFNESNKLKDFVFFCRSERHLFLVFLKDAKRPLLNPVLLIASLLKITASEKEEKTTARAVSRDDQNSTTRAAIARGVPAATDRPPSHREATAQLAARSVPRPAARVVLAARDGNVSTQRAAPRAALWTSGGRALSCV